MGNVGMTKKETKLVDGYEVCVNFDTSTYYCILHKKSRNCDGICIFVKSDPKDVPILGERD